MQKSIILALALVAIAFGALENAGRNPDFMDFVKWMKYYEVTFPDGQLEDRYNAWAVAQDRIARKNFVGKSSVEYGMNQFSHLSAEEFKAYSCGGALNGASAPAASGFTSYPSGTPKVFDWSTSAPKTHISNQRSSQQCQAFSAISAVEGVLAAFQQKSIELSEQQLIDCTETTGYPSNVLEYIAKEGIEADADYSAINRARSRTACKHSAEKNVVQPKSVEVYCSAASAPCNEETLADAIFNNGPATVCFDATLLQDYKSGIIVPSADNVCSKELNACGTLVGFGAENGIRFWKVQTSYGAKFGEEGFFRIEARTGACGINRMVAGVKL